eukprot:1012780-Prorocentrum_minimum.AAC.1
MSRSSIWKHQSASSRVKFGKLAAIVCKSSVNSELGIKSEPLTFRCVRLRAWLENPAPNPFRLSLRRPCMPLKLSSTRPVLFLIIPATSVHLTIWQSDRSSRVRLVHADNADR